MYRRDFMKLVGAGLMVWNTRLVHASDSQRPRIIWVLLRGGMDSLHAVIPHGVNPYPREYLVSALRLCGAEQLITRRTFAELKQMGQSPFDAGSPAGYSALNDAWSGSDALMKRIDWAANFSEKVDGDPLEIADQAFGGSISETTYQSVKRAESRSQGLALLLLSPEFQSR